MFFILLKSKEAAAGAAKPSTQQREKERANPCIPDKDRVQEETFEQNAHRVPFEVVLLYCPHPEPSVVCTKRTEDVKPSG